METELLQPQRPTSHERMRYRYYIVNKPRNVLSARGDTGTRPKNAPDLKRMDLYDVVRAKGFPTDVGCVGPVCKSRPRTASSVWTCKLRKLMIHAVMQLLK